MAASRVKLAQHAKDVLWSESAGHCQNPGCRLDLHALTDKTSIGEMAHVIPASDDGPRADEASGLDEQGRARPENVIVLCPNCHRLIDKDADAYPAADLRAWKSLSQQVRAATYGVAVFSQREEARHAVSPLLRSNRTVHDLYGPVHGLFDEVRADQWSRHLTRTIIPNTTRLEAIIEANRHLLTHEEGRTVGSFSVHAADLRARHQEGDWTPGSSMFPIAMEDLFDDPLSVMSSDVGQSGDWWPAADGGVGAVVIVEVEPAG